MRARMELTAVLAVLAPLLGTLAAAPLRFPVITGYWQGLVVQAFLLLAPLDLLVHRRGWGFAGL